MRTAITIRNVPDDIRSELALQAARAGRSLQEHLLAELTRRARRGNPGELLGRIQARKASTGSRLDRSRILAHLGSNRR